MKSSSGSGSEGPSPTQSARNESLLTELRRLYRPAAGSGSVEISFEADGQVHSARLIEFSEKGAKLAAAYTPQVGSTLAVGRVIARVVEQLQDGFTIEFLDIAEC